MPHPVVNNLDDTTNQRKEIDSFLKESKSSISDYFDRNFIILLSIGKNWKGKYNWSAIQVGRKAVSWQGSNQVVLLRLQSNTQFTIALK